MSYLPEEHFLPAHLSPSDCPELPPPADLSHLTLTDEELYVVPRTLADGREYPKQLRDQQVYSNQLDLLERRLAKFLAGGPIRVGESVLQRSHKELLHAHVLRKMLPEIYIDPLPEPTKVVDRFDSHKTVRELATRMEHISKAGFIRLGEVVIKGRELRELMKFLKEDLLPEEYANG